MGRRMIALGTALCAALFVSISAAASAAATTARSSARSADSATQSFGSATLYGTSAPVSVAASASAPNAGALHRFDSSTAHVFTHHASRTARSNTLRALTPPSPQGTVVVNSPGQATGFNGVSHADQRLAGTGKYAGTQFSLEPPDQGLCVGNGFVVEPINDAFRVFDEHGNALTATTALNQFYLRSPAIIRNTPPTPSVLGDFLSDPKCYYDPVGQRFIQTVLEVDSPGPSNVFPFFQRNHVLIAVSQTSDPTGAWNLFSLDTSDDGLNGTPTHTQCPCLPDQPLLGANRDGVFIDTNQFQNNAQAFFNGGQIYALGREHLESGASAVGFVHLDVGKVPTGDANLPFWGSIQPSTSLDPRRNTELLMSGGPEDVFQNNATLDNRIAVWSLTGTRSLNGDEPNLALHHVVLTSETYGLTPNTGASQKSGPTPLRDAINARGGQQEVLEALNANDSRMNQVVNVDGVLYGGVNTAVASSSGPARVGIAYFSVAASQGEEGLRAHIRHQGYVAVDGNNVLFPSIAVDRSGAGAMAFTLTGPDFFPSAAYVRFDDGQTFGRIHVSGAGALPEDGFTGYAFFGAPAPGVARWGDYSAAVSADGAIWMGNEFIPSTPRTVNANWGTFITRLAS